MRCVDGRSFHDWKCVIVLDADWLLYQCKDCKMIQKVHESSGPVDDWIMENGLPKNPRREKEY